MNYQDKLIKLMLLFLKKIVKYRLGNQLLIGPNYFTLVKSSKLNPNQPKKIKFSSAKNFFFEANRRDITNQKKNQECF